MAKGKRKKSGNTGLGSVSKDSQQRKTKHIQESISTKKKMLIGLVMAVLAMAIYAPSYNYEYVYDDDAVIKDNKYVQEGLAGLGKIWTTTYFKGYDETMNANAFRPVPLTTLAIETEIFGLNPTVNHVFNLLFYGMTAFFLFMFLSKLLRDHHPAFPIIAVLLFLFHPIHIEVVANIKSRDTMLGFLNFCIASWLLLKYVDRPKVQLLVGSLFFYFIALFSKEEVITTVAIIPAMLWCFRKIPFHKIAVLSLMYVGAAVIFLLAYFKTLGGAGEGVDITYLDNTLLAAEGIAQRSASTIFNLGYYLSKTVFPHPLISDYAFSTIPLTDWGDWRVYLALLLNLGMFGLGLWGTFKKKAWGFALFWYFTTLSIFTSIVTPNVSCYNDRFLYTPVLGICLLVAWGLTRFINTGEAEGNVASFFKKNFIVVAIVAILCAVSVAKVESHLPTWKDRFALFENDVRLAPNNARALKNHGGSLARLALDFQKTDRAKTEHFAKEAIKQLDASMAIYPYLPTGHIHKGNMYIMLQQYEQAIASFTTALEMAPANYYARSSLANVLYRTNRYAEAIETLQVLDPQSLSESDQQVITLSRQALGN